MTAGASVARFGRVQVEMLECVHQHRLLSTAQLHALYRDGLALRRTQRALAAMESVGWLGSVRQPGGMKLWFVTESGADAVEALGGRAELRRKVIAPEQAAGPLQQHTLAVNEVGVAFARAARERGDEFGPLAWRNEIAHPIGPPPGRRRAEMLIADAVLSYEAIEAERTHFHTAFLELDRATMAVESLVAKLSRYVRLAAFRGSGRRRDPLRPLWREYYAYFPSVLVVLANGSRRRLARRRRLVLALWQKDHQAASERIGLRVCLYEDLIEQGPFAAIFMSNGTDGPVDWRGHPPPELDTSGQAEEVEPAPDDDAAATERSEPARPREREREPEPEPAAPEPPTPSSGDRDRELDRGAAPYDGGRGDGLLPLPDLGSSAGERDPWGRW